jgi:hypothetical protein
MELNNCVVREVRQKSETESLWYTFKVDFPKASNKDAFSVAGIVLRIHVVACVCV